jgi:RND family efflux transporter MFP subunit
LESARVTREAGGTKAGPDRNRITVLFTVPVNALKLRRVWSKRLTVRGIFQLTPVFAAFMVCACSASSARTASNVRPAPLVAVARVEVRDVPVTVSAPVDLRPLQVVDIGSKTLGYLDAVLVDWGDRVKRRQLIATVRPSDLPDQLDAERAARTQTQAAIALARSNYDRAQKLSPSGLVSVQELQQATSSLATSQAAEAASKARIEALAVRIGETRIVSPIDGYVLARRLDPGALVGPGAAGPIVTVAQTRTLRVFVAVNEHDAPRIHLGQDAQVELDAFVGRVFSGKVVRISPAFDLSTRTLNVEVQLPNPEGELRIGMYGRASIVLEVHSNATVVPDSAVVINSLGRFAFVLDGDKVRRRTIETGVDGGTWLEVLKGLAAGEEVVTLGTDALADGMQVRVSRADSKAVGPTTSKGLANNPGS